MTDKDHEALAALYAAYEALLRVEREAERARAALSEDEKELRMLLWRILEEAETQRSELGSLLIVFRSAHCTVADEADA